MFKITLICCLLVSFAVALPVETEKTAAAKADETLPAVETAKPVAADVKPTDEKTTKVEKTETETAGIEAADAPASEATDGTNSEKFLLSKFTTTTPSTTPMMMMMMMDGK